MYSKQLEFVTVRASDAYIWFVWTLPHYFSLVSHTYSLFAESALDGLVLV
jgi:hypothetical protein